MKTIRSFFSQTSNDSERGRTFFAGAFDDNSVQHHTIFQRLRDIYLPSEEQKRDFVRLTLRAGALAFYDEATCSSSLSYRILIHAFDTRFASPTRCEENSKILASLSLDNSMGEEKDEHSALKRIIERVAILAHFGSTRQIFRE